MDISKLWDGSHLTLPKRLGDAYRSVLHENGLLPEAIGPRPSPPPVGGLTQEQTDIHFAHAFDGSAARAELVLLNPNGETESAATVLRQFLSGGALCLVDVPCGAGAGSLALLSTIAELRKEQELPRQPLDVRLLWGEISAPALKYALRLLAEIEGDLADQGITVVVETLPWDVLDEVSNVELVQKIAQTKATHPQILLLVCNFSGFLERQGKWKAAAPGLKMLLQFCSGDMNAGVWLEPDQKAVSKGLFQKLGNLIGGLIAFAKQVGEDDEGDAASAKFYCPIGTGKTHRVSARTMPFELALKRSSK